MPTFVPEPFPPETLPAGAYVCQQQEGGYVLFTEDEFKSPQTVVPTEPGAA